MVSGGAPLNPDIGVFFDAMGLTLLQGYGQTESAPVVSCNRPRAGIKMDTVGPPLVETEVRIAEDGPYVIAVDLGVDRAVVARVGLGGRILQLQDGVGA